MLYVNLHYVMHIPWVLLEVKIPRNILKSPRAMELVFNTLHSAYEGSRMDKYWKGFVKGVFSFEIASTGGSLRFFVRTPKAMRNLIEAQIYAQYPEVEIVEADDYTKSIPEDVPNVDWNLWGVEFGQTKEDAFPIKTYVDFKLEDVKEEMEKIDPMSSMLEFMASVKEGESVWFQLLIRAADDRWIKEGMKLKEAILAKKRGKPGEHPQPLSPGDTDVLKSLERNMTKLGFEAGIRAMYLARRDVFNPVNIASIMGVMKQYNTQNLNGFKSQANTSGGFWFKSSREYRKQRMMINAYKARGYFYPPFSRGLLLSRDGRAGVLTTEELATIYHYPGMVVSAPTFERVERKKGMPPSNLPV
ncbi:MAG: hypothetical protein AAB378_02010 [Patescibacteria group bacterium]